MEIRKFKSEYIKINSSVNKELKNGIYKLTFEKITLKKFDNEEFIQFKTFVNENIIRFLGISDEYFIFQKCYSTLGYIFHEKYKFNIKDLIFNISQALEYIHDMGYIHGNINEENIIFTERIEDKYYESKLKLTGKINKGDKNGDIVSFNNIISKINNY